MSSDKTILEYAKEYVTLILEVQGPLSKDDLIRAFEAGWKTSQIHDAMNEYFGPLPELDS